MALVNTHKGRLPDARAVLYDETIDILLWRWEQGSKGQEARLRQLLLEANYQDKDLEQVIWQLAYEAHGQTNAEDEKDSLADISELKLQKALAEKNNGNLNWAAQIIETMKLRAGLLLERDTGVFTFPHRSFQEYLAAAHLDAQDDFVDYVKSLTGNLSIWRDVILWAVSRRVYVRGSISGPVALVAELCPSRVPSNPGDWSNIWLAGDVLLEIGLNRVQNSELGKELLPRVQNRLVDLIEANALAPRERAESGDTLARLGDPRFDEQNWYLPKEPLVGFVHIPAGDFQMGTSKKDIKGLIEKFGGDEDDYKDETPQHNVTLPDYFTARYPVTVAQFKAFAEDREYEAANPISVQGVPNHPVVYVTWYDALEYCRWLTEKLRERAQKYVRSAVELRNEHKRSFWQGLAEGKLIASLPGEAEWEKAARGTDGRNFSWEGEFDQDKANVNMNIGRTSPVGCFSQGRSPYDLLDTTGNVWEWTRSEYKKYPFNPKAKLEKITDTNIAPVMRGGAFGDTEWGARCAYRFRRSPNRGWLGGGFRVVVVSPLFL